MLDQVQIPWEGAIFGKRGAHCEVYGLRAVSCAKWLNRSICRLGCGLGWAPEAQVQLYSPGGANVPSWESTLAPSGAYD